LGRGHGRPRQPSLNQDGELKAAQFRPKRAVSAVGAKQWIER